MERRKARASQWRALGASLRLGFFAVGIGSALPAEPAVGAGLGSVAPAEPHPTSTATALFAPGHDAAGGAELVRRAPGNLAARSATRPGGALESGPSSFSQSIEPMRATTPPVRKPGVAFLLSALLPGAGQLYNGNQRGYAYLAVEAAAWFARSSYIDAGNRKEGESEAFGRRHWDYDRFRSRRGEDGCGASAEADSLILSYLGEDLDQFYQEIANADVYRCGWDDFVFDPNNPGALSPRRIEYRDERQKANDLKENAGFALGILILNRIVSAVDAFRVARSRAAGSEPEFRFTGRLDGRWDEPRAVFQLTRELP